MKDENEQEKPCNTKSAFMKDFQLKRVKQLQAIIATTVTSWVFYRTVENGLDSVKTMSNEMAQEAISRNSTRFLGEDLRLKECFFSSGEAYAGVLFKNVAL